MYENQKYCKIKMPEEWNKVLALTQNQTSNKGYTCYQHRHGVFA